MVDGLLYGTDVVSGNELHVSDDLGDNWTEVQDLGVGSAINGLRKLADGEVLLMRRASGLYKSSGWASDPTTATWSQVLVPNQGATPAYILPWGVDVSDNVVIATEYVNNPRDASRYVYVSTDNGDTWDTVLDLEVLYPGEESAVHWHAVCIDPWANNRLWASNGDGFHGIFYSDDLGDNWTRITEDWQPTAMGATPYGIVCGTDELEEGLMKILRQSPLRIEGMYQLKIFGWYGFANRVWRDSTTNLVYVPWQVDTAGLSAHIMVSNGKYGHTLHEVEAADGTDTPNIRHVFVIDGTLIASYTSDSTEYILRGTLS